MADKRSAVFLGLSHPRPKVRTLFGWSEWEAERSSEYWAPHKADWFQGAAGAGGRDILGSKPKLSETRGAHPVVILLISLRIQTDRSSHLKRRVSIWSARCQGKHTTLGPAGKGSCEQVIHPVNAQCLRGPILTWFVFPCVGFLKS